MDLIMMKPGLRAIFINIYGGINPIHEGAKGVDMGRNIWQSDNAVGMIKAIRKIVHEGATVKRRGKIDKITVAILTVKAYNF
jgi:succinyl-CoA synthetase beta subunit